MAEALKRVRDVLWLEDRFSHDAEDKKWLEEVGRNGWIAILRDKRVRTRIWERQAIVDHGVGCFILNQGRDPTRWEYLKLLAITLDEMERLAADTPRPFIFTVSQEGRFRQVLH